MNWQDAARMSPDGAAIRTSTREGETVHWIRLLDGEVYYWFRGQWHWAESLSGQVEGCTDWEPMRDE